jgi:hypothetical protein
VSGFKRFNGSHEVAVGPFRQTHQSEKRVGDAATSGQNDGLARIDGRLDDVGNSPKATGIGDARTTKLMYDPFIHTSNARHAGPGFRAIPIFLS